MISVEINNDTIQIIMASIIWIVLIIFLFKDNKKDE